MTYDVIYKKFEIRKKSNCFRWHKYWYKKSKDIIIINFRIVLSCGKVEILILVSDGDILLYFLKY